MTTTTWNGLDLHGVSWREPFRWGTNPPDGECYVDSASLLSAADVADWFGDELGIHDDPAPDEKTRRVAAWLVPENEGEMLPQWVFDWFDARFEDRMRDAMAEAGVVRR